MTTWTAITKLNTQGDAETLADALSELAITPIGVACLEIEDGSGLYEVAGYFDQIPDEIALMLLAAAHNAPAFIISKLDDKDWVAQVRRELTPVRAGGFLVYGRHDKDSLWPSDIGLEIEAAMAFGTGHHGTTLGCLLATEELFHAGISPRKIADIGTGTGILAMAAARRWHRAFIVASDIENISVATSRANFAINKAKRIRIIEATGFNHPLHRETAPYELIYANILARPLRRLAREVYRNCAMGGYVVLSGILHWQGQGVISTYRSNGFKLVSQRRIGEWMSYILVKA